MIAEKASDLILARLRAGIATSARAA